MTFLNIYFIESFYVWDSSLRSCIPVYLQSLLYCEQEKPYKKLEHKQSCIVIQKNVVLFQLDKHPTSIRHDKEAANSI